MSKRLAIHNQLSLDLPTIPIYQPHVVTKATSKPFIVVSSFDEIITNISNGFDKFYLIFGYIDMYLDIVSLDTLIDNIKNSLHNTIITYSTENYQIDYEGFYGNQIIEEDWGAVGQGLQFKINELIL